ncbi:DNAJ protein JJJ1 homolog [Cicer arietinum]|uniref:DNAJ protein JJJ1 homolog n=1 Tax=Cicer arietinum TaxID=3827 RepID=A0A1S2YRB0_CICAR|nr:DNAJ protein JJJ1 homolog [Cicer arietinum]
MASAKRCHYEVLGGISRDCSPEEIRSAYRKLALQRHPDKLVKSGLSQAEATAQFQELQHAYEVLSDPKERAWYDSHRSQILFSDPNSHSNSVVPDLFSYFSNTVYSGYSDSGKGFYKVYSDVFDKIQANEINFAKKLGLGIDSVRQAPLMGNLDSPYAQVTAFYSYWLGFSTVMDFCWADEYDAMAGPNRKSRRLMEEENNKVRRKAKREYNDTVRKLADFVKKRDKRVIDMKVKKNLEMEKKKEEEREKKMKLEKEKKERAMAYEEPEWAKVDEEEVEDLFEEDEFEGKKDEKEFYCVLCGKKFKSEKQWKNHEQSKKHKEKVAQFRDSLEDEEEELEVEVEEEGGSEREGVGEERLESEEDGTEVNEDQVGETDCGVDDLEERIRDGLNVADEENAHGVEPNADNDDDDEIFYAPHANEGEEAGVSVDYDDNDDDNDNDENGVLETMIAGHKGRVDFDENDGDGDDDDEIGVLEAMLAGRKSRKPGASNPKSKASVTPTQMENENESDDVGAMEYNNRKVTRKKRRAKKEKGGKNGDESHVPANGKYENINSNGNDDSYAQESSSQNFEETEDNGGKENEQMGRDNKKISNKPVDKKAISKDTKTKAKISSKGRKAKNSSKNLGHFCETCEEEFESRNKLHKHLSDSGHAAIKSR